MSKPTIDFGPFGMGCPHAIFNGDFCIFCDGDGTEVIKRCEKCHPSPSRGMTWHRGDRCLRCNPMPTKEGKVRQTIGVD